MTKRFKIYGAEGHRQRHSFAPSCEFETFDGIHIVIKNCDITGTNEYSILEITTDDEEKIEWEMWAQISDGAFEDSRVGKIEEF